MCGAFVGGKVGGEGGPWRHLGVAHVRGRVSASCMCSGCAVATTCVHMGAGLCTHVGAHPLSSPLLAACGTQWVTGGAASPCTCVVSLSPVQGADRGNGNNEASCAAGNRPKGSSDWGAAVAWAMLRGTLVSPGDGTCVFAERPRQRSGALCKCMPPAVANTPALPMCRCPPWGHG